MPIVVDAVDVGDLFLLCPVYSMRYNKILRDTLFSEKYLKWNVFNRGIERVIS